MGKKSAGAAIFILGAILAAAQTPELPPVPALPVEAPASLLSLKLGDSDVELIAEGYWEVSVLASGAFGFGENAGVSAPTLLFRQVPDLWLSLTILDRWFVEASLSAEGFGDEYAAGYEGGEGSSSGKCAWETRASRFPTFPSFPWVPAAPPPSVFPPSDGATRAAPIFFCGTTRPGGCPRPGSGTGRSTERNTTPRSTSGAGGSHCRIRACQTWSCISRAAQGH
ncbi:MAG: hypothetical protein MZU95_08955 [Desulfomicrobium escambiense]|nr:hypothetical protein [Desulfomicrobium escambiense]